MAKLLRLRRGTTTQHGSFTGAEGEVTVDTDKDTLVVHDNATAGGRPMLREDLNNMPASGVTAGTYGSSSAIPAITVDAKGRITSATTSAIDSTAITNGTSNVSVAASGDITATRAGTQRLAVTSTGIDVTGTVTCDGMTCEGSALISASNGILQIRDNDTTSNADSIVYIEGQKSDGSQRWTFGDVDSTGDIYIANASNSTIYFQTNGTNRAGINSTALFPHANATYDIGTASQQWNNAYFDGTVNTDGLDCDGAAHIQVDSAVEATPLTVYNGTSGGNTRLLLSSYPNGSGDPFIKFDAGGTDMAVGLHWVSGANTLKLGPGTNPASINGMQIDVSGHCSPTSNNNNDLGTSSLRWRNVYTNDLNLSNEGGSNDVDGTWGSWTIQEGEDDLFLLNRRNGKKYKFNLSEVN